jgi:hypothetical protein
MPPEPRLDIAVTGGPGQLGLHPQDPEPARPKPAGMIHHGMVLRA